MPVRLKRLSPSVPPILLQAGVYTLSGLVSRAIPFLLLPVVTRYLSPADYGTVTMFLLLAMLLDPIITLGLSGAVTVKYFDKTTDLPAYIGTGTMVLVLAAVICGLIVFLLRGPISGLTEVPTSWLPLVIVLILARAAVGLVLAQLRVRDKIALYGVAQSLQSGSLVLVVLLMVVVLGRGWAGRLEAELLVWSTLGIAGLILMSRAGWIRFVFAWSYARDLVRFGGPLIPHTLGAVLILQSDRLMLTNLVGVDETGLYTVGYQLASVIELIALSANYAFAPWLFKRLGNADDQARRRLVRLTYAQFGLMAGLAIAVAAAMPWLASHLLGASYANSGRFIPWFALGFLFSGMYYMVTNYIFYVQRTAWLAAVTVTTALVNVPLTYGLIKLNGGVGAAQAMAISMGLSFVLTWIVSHRVYPMPWFSRLKSSVDTDAGR